MKKIYNWFIKQTLEYDGDVSVKESVKITDSFGTTIKMSLAEAESYLIPSLKEMVKDVEEFYRDRYLAKKKKDFDDAVQKNDLSALSFFCIHNERYDSCEYYCKLSGKYCNSNCGKQDLNWKHEC